MRLILIDTEIAAESKTLENLRIFSQSLVNIINYFEIHKSRDL